MVDLRKGVRAMNRIVREHYPVSKLPKDLQAELGSALSVKLVIEIENSRRPTRAEIEADMANWVSAPEDDNDDAAKRVRKLRDEWDH
jgi:hypothetical protein